MKLVLIGIPGAGKSTQGNLLSRQLNIPYLSTGHIFREIAKEKTQLGRYVKEIMSSGHLISDDKTIEIVNTYLSKPEYGKGYILDGFPRTTEQANRFQNHVDRIIYLAIPDKEALWRLAHRVDDRDDNTIKAIRKRIEIFHKLTEPVLEYYRKKDKLFEVDGTEDIKKVNETILKGLGKQIVKNQVQSWVRKHKSIIAVTGLPGAGKTEASDYFRTKELPVISFSRVINEYIDKNKLAHTLDVHKRIRMEFRKKYGMEAMAFLSAKKLKTMMSKDPIIVVEGMRSWEEYIYLKKEFPKVKVYILAVYADKHLRYGRISMRKSRSGLRGEQRDIDELLGTNMGPTIAFADFLVKNNFSKQEFFDKLDEVFRTVYYL